MARVRGRVTTKTGADVQLDTSDEHPALTPVMRRVAGGYWEIVRARAAEQALPIVRAWLWPYLDVEGTYVVFLVVHLDAFAERVSAFHHGLNPDRRHWYAQLDAEDQKASLRLALTPVGIRGREASAMALDGASMNRIDLADNLNVLPCIGDGAASLIYIDPPFNTGKVQRRERLRTVHDEEAGDRSGFQGRRYRTAKLGALAFPDVFEDFLEFIKPRLEHAYRILSPSGSFFLHIDYREVHYCKVLLDSIFGHECFMNEIVWAYDYGGRPKDRWPAKHDTLLWYVKNPRCYTFNYEAIDRIPYMAPGLVGPEKAARGKTPTDVWWQTIVPTNGRERTGYPTQKPLPILERIVKVHSNPGDLVLDFFAGSGTTGEAAARNGRRFWLIDSSPDAARVMARRLAFSNPECVGFSPEHINSQASLKGIL